MDKMYLGKFTFANGGLVKLNEGLNMDPRGQDISIPNLRKVKIKKAPSWKKP